MNLLNLKFSGIYDSNVLNILENENINNLAFDFRPKSMNFIQIYKFLDMIEFISLSKKNIFLQFSDEKDFVIDSILNDIKNSSLSSVLKEKKLYLDFYDSSLKSISYYDQFNIPFYIRYQADNISVLNAKYLEGVILENSHLNYLHEINKLNDFLADFIRNTSNYKLKINLNVNWGETIIASVFDFLSIHLINFNIDNSVEKGYRVVDPIKLSGSIKHVQSLEL